MQQYLSGEAPVIAASDCVRAWPQLVLPHMQAPVTVLGTDGFGRSGTRAALRGFFEVDRHQIVLAALTALRAQGRVDAADCAAAIERASPPSWQHPGVADARTSTCRGRPSGL